MAKTVHYNIGLDIGTNSIGWAIIDDHFNLVHVKGHNGIGTRIFREGKTAADTRNFRTTRRRLSRRKWRLNFLRGIFEPHISKIDENFFMRQKESNLVDQDSSKHFKGSILFNNRSDKDFYHDYPTIYHLRYALMTKKQKFDIREVYLAMHHIVKYRGHFLNEAPVSAFKRQKFNLKDDFSSLNELFSRFLPDVNFELNLQSLSKVESVLLDTSRSRLDRQRELVNEIYDKPDDKANDKNLEKLRKSIATEILKAMLGLKAKFNVITGVETDDTSTWTITFEDEEIETKVAELDEQLDDDGRDVIDILRRINSAITLSGIVPNGKSLSEAMISKYNAHCKQLEQLKILETKVDHKTAKLLKNAYDGYIDGVKGKKLPRDDFYKKIKAILSKVEDPIKEDIFKLIELNQFLPKQRTKENGVIPHQLQQQEMQQIIENQKEYYPWLAEENPNQRDKGIAKYKLEELVVFRVPYYVGPMVDPTADKNGENREQNAKFAWMKRNSEGEITPWNFDQMVDRDESAERFIKQMTTKDTYLMSEDVLPKRSLLYQKFEVLNELNNVRVNGQKLDIDVKQAIYQNLFKKFARVTLKRLKDYLIAAGKFSADEAIEIKGLAAETHFLSGLTTENDLRKIFGDKIDDSSLTSDFEQIIEWSTVFEDSKIMLRKLDEISWLTTDQKQKLAGKRYRGWGRLSRKLLKDIRDVNGESIMNLLWDTDNNFMILVNLPVFKQKIEKANSSFLRKNLTQDVINDLYTSPQNKKAIRQVIKVVKDIQNAMGDIAPDKISIEFARENETNPRRSIQRLRQLNSVYSNISHEIIENLEVRKQFAKVSNGELNRDRLFLYFLQGGRDLYTGDRLNIDLLPSYDIDHILPQAFIKDDSLDNRVLVAASDNRNKSDSLPADAFTSEKYAQRKSLWLQLYNAGLISKRKYRNLTFNPNNINKYSSKGFIHRQLVETRQVIKLVAKLLDDMYTDDGTQIISVKAGLTHQMREDFDFPKNRDVNNYHHAFDAYLSAFVGQYLLKRYPKLSPYFVYGDFKAGKLDNISKFNFLGDLKNEEKVVNSETGEIIVTKASQLNYMNKIYSYKKILVTHEVYENRGALFAQTIYKASDDKASGRGTKKLIRQKNNRPTELYGGYSNSNDEFLTIVRLKKKDVAYYKVIGIPVRVANKIRLDNDKVDINKLSEYLKTVFSKVKQNRKTGKKASSIEWFEIVVPKVPFGQLIIDEGQPFLLGSSTYRHNAQELVLPKTIIKQINQSTTDKVDYDGVYQEILKSVLQYFPLYDINQFRRKLKVGFEKFQELPNDNLVKNGKVIKQGKLNIINKILIGLHANAAFADLKSIGFSTAFGFLQQPSGISLSKNAEIVYQSPTGLFTRFVKLSEV